MKVPLPALATEQTGFICSKICRLHVDCSPWGKLKPVLGTTRLTRNQQLALAQDTQAGLVPQYTQGQGAPVLQTSLPSAGQSGQTSTLDFKGPSPKALVVAFPEQLASKAANFVNCRDGLSPQYQLLEKLS